MQYNCECIQVEAATGGQDVIRFCGGLTAVLAAVGIPLSKALPSSQLQPSCPINPPTLQPHRPGTAPVTAAGQAPASRCHSHEREPQLELDQSRVPSGQSRDADAAKQQAAGSASEQVCMQLLARAARHDQSQCRQRFMYRSPACMLTTMVFACGQYMCYCLVHSGACRGYVCCCSGILQLCLWPVCVSPSCAAVRAECMSVAVQVVSGCACACVFVTVLCGSACGVYVSCCSGSLQLCLWPVCVSLSLMFPLSLLDNLLSTMPCCCITTDRVQRSMQSVCWLLFRWSSALPTMMTSAEGYRAGSFSPACWVALLSYPMPP